MCTVLEISGRDRHGLMSDIMDAFATRACSVWSASIWTNNRGRATFVLGVRDSRKPLADEGNWEALKEVLLDLLGGAAAGATVARDAVVRCVLEIPQTNLCKLGSMWCAICVHTILLQRTYVLLHCAAVHRPTLCPGAPSAGAPRAAAA
jgi:hypothetical protein